MLLQSPSPITLQKQGNGPIQPAARTGNPRQRFDGTGPQRPTPLRRHQKQKVSCNDGPGLPAGPKQSRQNRRKNLRATPIPETRHLNNNLMFLRKSFWAEKMNST